MKVLIPMTAALVTLSLLINPTNSNANASMGGAQILNDNTASANSQNPFDSQRELYDKLSSVTNVEWYWVAAVDQYERTMSRARPKARPLLGETVGVFIDKELWAGILNPDDEDNSPLSIRWFNGIGRDGDGNGIAERNSDFDLLYSLIRHTSLKVQRMNIFPSGFGIIIKIVALFNVLNNLQQFISTTVSLICSNMPSHSQSEIITPIKTLGGINAVGAADEPMKVQIFLLDMALPSEAHVMALLKLKVGTNLGAGELVFAT